MDEFVIKPGIEGTVDFYDLPGIIKSLPGETPGEYLARINDPTKWLYGSELRDHLFLHSPSMLPRYAHLSRKAFIHYAGSKYNPHTIEFMDELVLRDLIKSMIEYKVQGRCKGYDWEGVNAVLMDMVHQILKIPFPEDYKPLDREVLPEFRSPFHGIELLPPN